MYWILFVMAFIASVVIAMVVGGLAIPRAHVASKDAVIHGSIDDVWRTIRTVSDYAAWRNDVEAVELVDQQQSQTRWREMSSGRSITFGIVAEQAPRELVVRILDDDLPFSGEWSWSLREEGAATRVTITERGEIGNPVFRLIATYVLGHTKTLERILHDLARKHG